MGFNSFPQEDKPSSLLWVGCFGLVFAALLASGIWVIGFFGESATVANETFGARATRDKYEWFKSAADAIEAARANILAQKGKIASMSKSYGETPRRSWDRVDKENLALWETELAGMVSAHNNLVARYNAAAKKSTWNFARSSELPQSFDFLTSQ